MHASLFKCQEMHGSPVLPSSGPVLAGYAAAASEPWLFSRKELTAEPPVAPSSSVPPGVRALLVGLERQEGTWSSEPSTGMAMQLQTEPVSVLSLCKERALAALRQRV